MKTNILPASDPSYPLVAGKLLEEMKIDQKNPCALFSSWLLWLLGKFSAAERPEDTEKYQSHVVLTEQDHLNLLGARLLTCPGELKCSWMH